MDDNAGVDGEEDKCDPDEEAIEDSEGVEGEDVL